MLELFCFKLKSPIAAQLIIHDSGVGRPDAINIKSEFEVALMTREITQEILLGFHLIFKRSVHFISVKLAIIPSI